MNIKAHKTLTWVGVQDGISDIGQAGVALQKIRAGYMAVVTLDNELTINICTGSIDGASLTGACPHIGPIPEGEHKIISPTSSGGFRIYR